MPLERLRTAIRRPIRYRITRGVAVRVRGGSGGRAAAVVSANNLLFLILATMLSTLLVSGLISRLCLAGPPS